MAEQFAELDESQDPRGFDILVSIELFEETMGSLARLYFSFGLRNNRSRPGYRIRS